MRTAKMKSPVSKTFTALPTSWLWPAGPPIWQISTLGAAVALTSVAVPALPTVLPDKTPSTQTPSAQAPSPGDDGVLSGESGTGGTAAVAAPATTSTPAATDPTAVPTVTAITPTGQPGVTATQAPTATTSSTPGSTPSATATAEPPAPTQDAAAPVTVAAADEGNQRWLVTSTTCATCVSGNRVIGIGLLATLTVPVESDTAGTRQLTIAYESRLDRDLYISVNGGSSQKVTVAGTGSFETPGWTTVSVNLQQGSNTIKFHNPIGLAPDLDQFQIG
ncbi:hypothetical protein KIH74_32630 [Kineosporia sp. J2-2]|uniref:CBM6 domain-containing protein n=1 Tax=Kineosporia corallincola TaxID=2835133 RepID=A0ABS5TSE5_9ACTN|nr:hypothetical protein [Kineosporia corallincola]MBT0773737.1 hypothetical protein [Kineosporia corallincola]